MIAVQSIGERTLDHVTTNKLISIYRLLTQLFAWIISTCFLLRRCRGISTKIETTESARTAQSVQLFLSKWMQNKKRTKIVISQQRDAEFCLWQCKTSVYFNVISLSAACNQDTTLFYLIRFPACWKSSISSDNAWRDKNKFILVRVEIFNSASCAAIQQMQVSVSQARMKVDWLTGGLTAHRHNKASSAMRR